LVGARKQIIIKTKNGVHKNLVWQLFDKYSKTVRGMVENIIFGDIIIWLTASLPVTQYSTSNRLEVGSDVPNISVSWRELY